MKTSEQGKPSYWIFVIILFISVPLLFVILYSMNSDTRRNNFETSTYDTTSIKKNIDTVKTNSVKKENK